MLRGVLLGMWSVGLPGHGNVPTACMGSNKVSKRNRDNLRTFLSASSPGSSPFWSCLRQPSSFLPTGKKDALTKTCPLYVGPAAGLVPCNGAIISWSSV